MLFLATPTPKFKIVIFMGFLFHKKILFFTGCSYGHWPLVADPLFLMDRHDLLMKGLSVGGNKQ